MTVVEGQIESLATLKDSLRRRGVTRFNSIGEIRSFLKDFETEKEQVPVKLQRELETEFQQLQSAYESHKLAYDELETTVRSDVEQQLLELNAEVTRARDRSKKTPFLKAVFFFKVLGLSRKASRLERNLEKIVRKKTSSADKTLARLEADLENFIKNRESLSSRRCEKSLQDLNHIKEVVDDLYNLVAGAIGEASVDKKLRQLTDEYYLINNFSMKFDPPVYNKKENDRIYSVQIDHLLISRAGIFLLETKNWSKASVQSLDLRSPVEQIRRTNFALFVSLNGHSETDDLGLTSHHWGAKKIPIRNVVVMINDKPKTDFQYVKVLSLDELLGYIQYFDETLDGVEVKAIFDYLKSRMWVLAQEQA